MSDAISRARSGFVRTARGMPVARDADPAWTFPWFWDSVQVPFASDVHDRLVTTSETRSVGADVTRAHHPADSTAADRLWGALYQARASRTMRAMVDLEDAVFRFYLPMTRTLALTVVGESADRALAERAAELGLAHAILAWRQRTSGGFRRFARSNMLRQLAGR